MRFDFSGGSESYLPGAQGGEHGKRVMCVKG